jgi:hypothetical protein
MEIGAPRRTYEIEPLEEPVPDVPAEEPTVSRPSEPDSAERAPDLVPS